MILEWAVGIIGTTLSASIGAVNARISRLNKKVCENSTAVGEHSVTLGKIPAEVKVAVLTAMREHEELNGRRFDGFQRTLSKIETDVGILKGRRD